MKIEWVNHASFILEKDNIRIISDPWLEGNVFDNGWSLLSKTKFQYEDFKNITHIWFSHEHPDHFFPPNIKKIPKEYREKITILFQQTNDRKVVNFCREQGFAEIIEMAPYKEYELSDDLKIMCTPFGHDSWISYKTSDQTFVNINDCEFSTKDQLMDVVRRVGKVDLLLTQFSFAGYPGTAESAKEKREKLALQANVLKPEYLIPFASFVWFCHEENYYMNKAINKIGDIYHYIQQETDAKPVILYPGEKWQLLSEHDSLASINMYNADYKKIEENPELVKTKVIDQAVLEQVYSKFVKDIKEKNNLFLVKLLMVKEPTVVYLTDYKKAFKMDIIKGTFEESNTDYDHCDIALSSDALHFSLKFPWGWDTLNINGRFHAPEHGNVHRFRSIGNVQLRNSHAEYLTTSYLIEKAIIRAKRKIKRLPQK